MRKLFSLSIIFGFATGLNAAAFATPPANGEGFVSIFDGKSLDGWHGDTKGYRVEQGVLVCTTDGRFLFSDEEYTDFHLKFEFKLTPGANNGLGVRAPDHGNPAYDGMEIQILDDYAPKYKDLHPYQFHGSVYGVVSAKRGHLKQAGKWNSEEIVCDGRRISVKLNGATIVDADLDEASRPHTLDGKDHPGIQRDKGHIVLFGHNAHVEFRNFRIKKIRTQTSAQ